MNDGAAAVVVTSASTGEATGRAAYGPCSRAGDKRNRPGVGDDGARGWHSENLGQDWLETGRR